MSVQEQLQQVLQGTLESRKEVRQAAEAALEQLSSEPQFGWELVTCALTCTSSPIAQMSLAGNEQLQCCGLTALSCICLPAAVLEQALVRSGRPFQTPFSPPGGALPKQSEAAERS